MSEQELPRTVHMVQEHVPNKTLVPEIPTAEMKQVPTKKTSFLFDDEVDIIPDRPPIFTRRRLILGISIIVVCAIVGTIIYQRTRPVEVPLKYTSAAVVVENMTTTVSATGQLAAQTYNLNFSANGKIAEIDVQVGQNVESGQVLARLDATSLQDALNSTQSNYDAASINYNNALTAKSNNDQLAYDNYQNALTAANGNEQKIQQATDQYNQSLVQNKSQLDSSHNALNASANQLTTAQHNMDSATLTAPASGQIASINGSVGSAPGSGNFIVLADLQAITITGQVNETDIGSVQSGQSVSFTVSAYPQQTLYGNVTTISPIGQTTQNVVTFPMTITVSPDSIKAARLLPGMTAQVTITTQQIIGATLVPSSALTYARNAVRAGRITSAQVQQALQSAQQMLSSATDESIKQGQASYVLNLENDKVVAVPIIIGISNGTNTVVLNGLKENEMVLTSDNKISTTTTSSTSRNQSNPGFQRPGSGLLGGF
jgi:HlyD family secretion protein